jgi:hypothetical protein
MLNNYDKYGHLRIGDVCRFEQSLAPRSSSLMIPELYEPRNWMVIAFGIGKDVDEVYVRRFHDGLVVKIPTYIAIANRLKHPKQGQGGFWAKIKAVQRINQTLYLDIAATLADAKRKRLI